MCAADQAIGRLTGQRLDQVELVQRAEQRVLGCRAKLSGVGAHVAAQHTVDIAVDRGGRWWLTAQLDDSLDDLLGQLGGCELAATEHIKSVVKSKGCLGTRDD